MRPEDEMMKADIAFVIAMAISAVVVLLACVWKGLI